MAAPAASDKTIGDKPVLDGVPDTDCDEADGDTDGVQGADVVEPTALARGLGIE